MPLNPEVVFQNEHFIAVNKPADCLSVPSRFQSEDSRPVLGHILREMLGEEVFPIHRLDYEVSGLILFALNKKAHAAANKAFEHRKVHKTYLALSEGLAPDWKEKTWKCKLMRGKKRAYEHNAGKLSVTDVEFKGAGENSELQWVLKPQTGRSHQLRYELYRHDCPILGDKLYSSSKDWSEGIALQSIALKFDQELTEFELPAQLALKSESHLFFF